MPIAYLFPGQGAQYAGIGRDLHAASPAVRATYEAANDALGYDLTALSFDDPEQRINLTRYTQPVLLTHSIACLRALEEAGCRVTPMAAAGHSLGEYSALVAAGRLDFADALRLVARRGELMGELGQGQMLSVELEEDAALELASRHHCALAACNLPRQCVIGGGEADLTAAEADLKQTHPDSRCTRLNTEGAFHTYYMIAAAQAFRDDLAQASFRPGNFAVMSNFSGRAHADDDTALGAALFLQLFNPVRWHANLLATHELGADTYIEFGGGLGDGDADAKRPNLAGIVKQTFRRTSPRPTYHAVINCRTLEETAQALT